MQIPYGIVYGILPSSAYNSTLLHTQMRHLFYYFMEYTHTQTHTTQKVREQEIEPTREGGYINFCYKFQALTGNVCPDSLELKLQHVLHICSWNVCCRLLL